MVMLQVSPISPGPTVPPRVTVSTWATGTTLAWVLVGAGGTSVVYADRFVPDDEKRRARAGASGD